MGTITSMSMVEVGPFKLPGVHIKDYGLTAPEEIEQWAEENRAGKKLTDTLWYFRNEKQRTLFMLRWAETTGC